MNKAQFQALCNNQYVILDGATGSNLQKKGMPTGVCPEKWILEHPQALVDLQKEYVEAGSHIVYAPTFTSNRIKLEEYGIYDQMKQIIHKLVNLSKEAVQGKAYIAGDITMTGKQLAPIGDLDFEELVNIYKEQIMYMCDAGVDLLVVETMMSLQETRAALIAAKECCDLPVMATLTFEKDGRTLFGTDPETAAIVLDKLGADAIGVNCSTGPAQMAQVLEKMAVVTAKPLIGKPNAGLPKAGADGSTVYDMDADAFAEEMKCLIKAGATIIGGCCGTSPEYIKKLKEIPYQKTERLYVKKGYLTSERKTVAFSTNDPFLVVGERINPTGKKAFQESVRAGSMDMVREFAEQQEANGAAILDVNLGMSGIDEKEKMLEALDELSLTTTLPLAIDSSHPEVMEVALRRYPGRALINSVSLEAVKMEKILPLAAKYGAMFILLPLSDEGLPATMEEKHKIIQTILQKALELGLSKEDIVVDGLVTTVGANPKAGVEALTTIKYCKENGLFTICGLSNISFGLPERSNVNTAFLTMAIQNGLTMAIANPNQELLMLASFASDLLCGKETSDVRYIEYAGIVKQRNEQKKELQKTVAVAEPKAVVTEKKSPEKRCFQTIQENNVYEAVMKGNRKKIVELVKDAVDTGLQAKQLLDAVLIPAINDVGELFDKGIYFLPQLINSAETMKLGIEYLEPLLMTGEDAGERPVIVIATVQGDIHDIGKNLVALMLKNYGYQVIDLGKDVSKETIVETAIENDAKIIGLSALMTTTMQEMRHVIEYARKQGYTGKIIIGGAVVTEEYAKEINGDGYSEDAADAVRLVERLLK